MIEDSFEMGDWITDATYCIAELIFLIIGLIIQSIQDRIRLKPRFLPL
jgi:hypothetical protein